MRSPKFWTFLRCLHLLEMTSHCTQIVSNSLNNFALHRKRAHLGRRTDNNITLLEQPQVGARLTRQRHNLLSALNLAKLLLPLRHSQVYHLLVRFDTHRPLLLASRAPQSHESKLRADRLSTARRSANEDVLIGRIESLEDLRLDLVEVLDPIGVDGLEFLVVKSGEGERLEVEKRRRGGELLGKNEMLEGDG